MKPALAALLLLVTANVLMAQGTLFFYNHVPDVGLDAPVFDTDGTTKLQGGQFQAQLFAGPNATSLSLVGPSASFNFEPGYWNSFYTSLDRVIPDVPPGDTAFCQVKVWSYLRGGSYEQVAAAGGKHGQSEIFSVTTGGAPGTGTEPPGFPNYLSGLKSFTLTGIDPAPEPATWALLGIGLCGLTLARRSRG